MKCLSYPCIVIFGIGQVTTYRLIHWWYLAGKGYQKLSVMSSTVTGRKAIKLETSG